MEYLRFNQNKKKGHERKQQNFLNDCLFIKHEWNVWEFDSRALSHCTPYGWIFWIVFCAEFYDSRTSRWLNPFVHKTFLGIVFYQQVMKSSKNISFWRKTFFGHFGSKFSIESSNSPCETTGLEQLRERGILELPGASDESSQCLLFILLVVVVLPQLEVDDALLLAVEEEILSKWVQRLKVVIVIQSYLDSLKNKIDGLKYTN